MVCVYCGKDTEVYNSRSKARNPSVWRRRRCIACQAAISTLELPDYSTSLVVAGVHGKLYPFNRDQLFLSIYRALEYRRDAIKSASDLTDTIIGRLLRTRKAVDGLVHIRAIAETSYMVLKRFDPPSAHTYKAYHRSLL